MTPEVIRHPIDPTGVSRNNLVQGEERTMVRHPLRVIVPIYGAFFADSLVVRDASGMMLLVRDVHFFITGLMREATSEFGQEVAAVIVITSQAVSNVVVLDYQAIGGKYRNTLPLAEEFANNLKNDNRILAFTALAERPSSFTPASHRHDAGDIYGFESICHAIERQDKMMELNSQVSHDLLYEKIDRSTSIFSSTNATNIAALMAAHTEQPNSHSSYLNKAAFEALRPIVRKPINLYPANAGINTSRTPKLTAKRYYSAYRTPHALVRFQLAKSSSFSSIVHDSGLIAPSVEYQVPVTLTANTLYYWRVLFIDSDANASPWSSATSFRTII